MLPRFTDRDDGAARDVRSFFVEMMYMIRADLRLVGASANLERIEKLS